MPKLSKYLEAANIADLFFNRSFLDPAVKGEYPEELIKIIKKEGLMSAVEDGRIEDDYRIDFVKNHLIWLHKSIEEGCNVKEYHMWTFVDNWSWSNAYKNRYCFIQLDLKTQKRTIKKSGYWIKEVSRNNGF